MFDEFGTISIILFMVIIVLIPFAVSGLVFLGKRKKMKGLIKDGYIKMIFLRRNGLLTERFVKPDSNLVEIDGARYMLADSAELRTPSVEERDQDVIEYFDYYITPEGLKTYIFDEDDSIPVNLKDKKSYLNPKYIAQVVKTTAATETPMFDRYFKVIIIAIFALGGLMFLFSGGGG